MKNEDTAGAFSRGIDIGTGTELAPAVPAIAIEIEKCEPKSCRAHVAQVTQHRADILDTSLLVAAVSLPPMVAGKATVSAEQSVKGRIVIGPTLGLSGYFQRENLEHRDTFVNRLEVMRIAFTPTIINRQTGEITLGRLVAKRPGTFVCPKCKIGTQLTPEVREVMRKGLKPQCWRPGETKDAPGCNGVDMQWQPSKLVLKDTDACVDTMMEIHATAARHTRETNILPRMYGLYKLQAAPSDTCDLVDERGLKIEAQANAQGFTLRSIELAVQAKSLAIVTVLLECTVDDHGHTADWCGFLHNDTLRGEQTQVKYEVALRPQRPRHRWRRTGDQPTV